jgi:A/G-specific adenine glycosylase
VSTRGRRRAAAQPVPAAADLAGPRRALLAWWDRGHRDLPWRRTRDPWAVLVSEVMLQQTTVAAVVPYWERFVSRWPRAADLARAGEDELLSAWAGLGYYRRARHLHAAARTVAQAGGELPRDAAGLRALPGIGDYTAAAVASIAHGEPVAAVDGNVERVLSRLFALPLDPRSTAGRAALRARAEALLDRQRPGDFNQALLELGATLCRPAAPSCLLCPLRESCAARAAGDPERFPARPARPAAVPMLRVAALVHRDGRVLLRRRSSAPNEGFLELPDVEVPLRAGESLDAAARPADAAASRRLRAALERALLREHGLRLRAGAPGAPVRHGIMRWTIRVVPLASALLSGRVRAPLQWADPRAPDLPLTTVARRVLAGEAEARGGPLAGYARARHAGARESR